MLSKSLIPDYHLFLSLIELQKWNQFVSLPQLAVVVWLSHSDCLWEKEEPWPWRSRQAVCYRSRNKALYFCIKTTLSGRFTLYDIYDFWCGTFLLKTVQCNAEQDCAQNFSTLWELGLERLHAVPEQLLLFSFYIHILLCQTRPDSLLILYEVLHKIYSTPVLCS